MSVHKHFTALLLGTLVAACSTPLAPVWLVSRPRIIAIIATPPAAMPGESIQLDAIVTNPSTVHWTWCSPAAGLIATAGSIDPSDDCLAGGSSAVAFGDTAHSMLGIPSDYFEQVEAALAHSDAGVPVDAIRAQETLGLPLVMVARLDDGSIAIHRVLVASSGPLNQNPQPIALDLRFEGDDEATALTAFPDGQCARADGRALNVSVGSDISIEVDSSYYAGLESYSSLGSDGVITMQTEVPNCALYDTSGARADASPQGACAGLKWTAPLDPGPTTHWFTLTDGRGGTAACRFAITVTASVH